MSKEMSTELKLNKYEKIYVIMDDGDTGLIK